MKKIYITLFALSLLTGAGNAHAGQQPRKGLDKLVGKSSRNKSSQLRTAAAKKLPQKVQNFYWIDTDETWMETGYTEFTYDQRGNVLSELTLGTAGDSSRIVLYSYNSRGERIEYIEQYYQGTEWVNSQKETTSYDTQGNLLETISYTWQSNQWKIQWGYKTQYSYDIQNRLIEEIELSYDKDEEDWIAGWKFVLGYSGNEQEPRTLTEYEYDGDEWIKTYEYTNIVWRSFTGTGEGWDFESLYYTEYYEGAEIAGRMSATIDGTTTVYLEEIYQEGEWTGTYRSTSTIEEDGSTVTINEYFEEGQWLYSDRSTEYRDSRGEYAGNKDEDYDSGEWSITYANILTNTYNDNDEKVETVSEYISPGSPVTKTKQEFSDFISIDMITGQPSSVAFTSLSLFPNPATDIISFENIPAGSEISIATIGNQTVLDTRLTETSARISVADLQPGIYFATIRSANGEAKTLKFIKQ